MEVESVGITKQNQQRETCSLKLLLSQGRGRSLGWKEPEESHRKNGIDHFLCMHCRVGVRRVGRGDEGGGGGGERLAFLLPMNFLEKTLRDWKVRLDPMAARKPPQLKVASEAEAATTPPTIGTSVASTAGLGVSPRNRLESSTEKKGSMDCTNG